MFICPLLSKILDTYVFPSDSCNYKIYRHDARHVCAANLRTSYIVAGDRNSTPKNVKRSLLLKRNPKEYIYRNITKTATL
jgi:hypothetical protein